MPTKLNAPIITLTNSTINIQNVPYALEFKIYANNILQTTINANIPQLDKISTFTQNNTIMSWNKVKNADAYIIKQGLSQIAQINDTEYDIREYTTDILNNIEFSIIAINTQQYYHDSNPAIILYTSPNLNTINDAKIINNILTWSAIPNAVKYNIYDNNIIIATTEETNFDLSIIDAKTHILNISSIAPGFVESKLSNTLLYIGPYLYDVINTTIKLYKAPYQTEEGGIKIL